MNIVKLGGSIVNPDGKYDNKAISRFIKIVKGSKDKFIFVVGGGKFCRNVQNSSKRFLKDALKNNQEVTHANDLLGIATTQINATYVLKKFKEKLGKKVYPEIILNPTQKIKSNCKVYFTGGWKPGCSTDKDMMLLAETFKANKVFKISDFEIVKNIKPIQLHNMSKVEKNNILTMAKEIEEMSWKDLDNLVGGKWIPGLNTPFDPKAAKIGLKLRKKLTLYIGRIEEFPKMVKGKKFKGTVVKG